MDCQPDKINPGRLTIRPGKNGTLRVPFLRYYLSQGKAPIAYFPDIIGFFWRARLQRIRTVGELPFEVDLVDIDR